MEVPMRRACICAATTVALLSDAWAGPDSDAVRLFALPGVWREDCTNPASRTNREIVFAAPEESLPTIKYYEGLPLNITYGMRDVLLVAPDRLAYTQTKVNEVLAMEILLRDSRLRAFQATDTKTGKVIVKDGLHVPTGRPTPLYERCPASVSRHSLPQRP
jgi:hypothetical protein